MPLELDCKTSGLIVQEEDWEMALLDKWRRAGAQRLQEVRQRSSQINSQLTQLQKERQAKGQKNKRELSEFREKLAQAEETRDRAEQQRSAVRKRLILNLQSETQTFLKNTRDRRQERAQKMAKNLDEFARSLAEQTAQFLADARSARLEMAKNQAEDLREFYTKLRITVAKQRQLNQAQQAFLKTKLNRDLGEFRKNLQLEISEYLQVCQENREGGAIALRSQLWLDRAKLSLEVWGSAAEQPQLGALEVKKAETSTPPEPEISAKDKGEKSVSIDWEETVYNYICQHQGARLAEIETALKLKRIQAVDILRALLQKGLISERDRTYTAEEKVTQRSRPI